MFSKNIFLIIPHYFTHNTRYTYLCYLVIFCISFSFQIQAKDILKFNEDSSNKKITYLHNIEVLEKAMQITEPEFGEYEIQFPVQDIPNLRIRGMITKGDIVNTAMMISTPEWESAAVPIRIPVRRGILNYRLLVINKQNKDAFINIKTIEELKKRSVGLNRQWATWQTMTKLGYKVINAHSYPTLFGMLNKQRFDYIPRGLHEIYDEVITYQDKDENLIIAPQIAICIPAPYYVFVSPKEPRLLNRLKLGLSRLAEQGILENMVNKYYGEYLKRADLKNRLILDVGNPDLPPLTPLQSKGLWLNWD